MSTRDQEAHDHSRVSPEGKRAGEWLAKFVYPSIVLLELDGEPDERCKTCAFRMGTVPNGCIQTQADAMKAVMEGIPFLCHQNMTKTCHGWFAGRRALKGRTIETPWEFSPPDGKEE